LLGISAVAMILTIALPSFLAMLSPRARREFLAFGLNPAPWALFVLLVLGSLAGIWSNGLPVSGWKGAIIAVVPLLGVYLSFAFC